jgi:hypothetical protein
MSKPRRKLSSRASRSSIATSKSPRRKKAAPPSPSPVLSSASILAVKARVERRRLILELSSRALRDLMRRLDQRGAQELSLEQAEMVWSWVGMFHAAWWDLLKSARMDGYPLLGQDPLRLEQL